jgi:hypothetical protein
MVAKLTRLTHKIAIQLHLIAESCTICSSHSRWSVWKLLDTPLTNAAGILLQLPCHFHYKIHVLNACQCFPHM